MMIEKMRRVRAIDVVIPELTFSDVYDMWFFRKPIELTIHNCSVTIRRSPLLQDQDVVILDINDLRFYRKLVYENYRQARRVIDDDLTTYFVGNIDQVELPEQPERPYRSRMP